MPPANPLFFEWGAHTELWFTLPIEAQEAIVTDDLACRQYIDQNEARARIHNELYK